MDSMPEKRIAIYDEEDKLETYSSRFQKYEES